MYPVVKKNKNGLLLVTANERLVPLIDIFSEITHNVQIHQGIYEAI